MFLDKQRKLPYLSDYIVAAVHRANSGDTGLGVVGGIVGAIGGLSGAVIAIATLSHLFIFNQASGILAVLGINLAAWLFMLGFWLHARKQRAKIPESEFTREARGIANHLYPVAHKNRLHRTIEPSVADLLEESARNWNRLNSCLTSAYWTSKDLPAHWQSIRDSSKVAADRAMDELLVLLKGSLVGVPVRKSGLEEFVEDVVETYVKGSRKREADLLPVGFEQARHIAERLKLLAAEIERCSTAILREEPVANQFNSTDAIDLALSDIRSVRAAEDELHQRLMQ